jgi:hypothetical protein
MWKVTLEYLPSRKSGLQDLRKQAQESENGLIIFKTQRYKYEILDFTENHKRA